MLSLMRRKAGSWVIKIILGAIVIVFVFWGVGSFRDEGQARVATINGQPITIEEYRDAYGNLLEQMRQRFGGNLTPEIIEMLQLRQQALNQLIDQRLLKLEAREMGLSVTDSELAESIARYPVFQQNGAFDAQLYQRVLAANRLTPEGFEALQRDMLLMDKVNALVTGSVKVSDLEVQEWYRWQHAEVALDYVLFAPEDFPVEITPEALEAHYAEHSQRYMSEPERRIRFVRFAAESYIDQVPITDDQIEAQYNARRQEFSQPKTVEARHILLRLDHDADDTEAETVRQRAEELIARLGALESFEELAQQYSDDPGQDGAGYLGYFEFEDMVTPFAEAAFSMQAGEISPPVRTRFGWHIIRVEDVRPAKDILLADVQDEIRSQLQLEAARPLALQHAEDVFLQAFEDDDLKLIAEAHTLAAFETEFFSRAAPAPELPRDHQVVSTLFELPVMEISDVIEADGNYYLFQILEARPAAVRPLAEVEAQVSADVQQQLQDTAARQAAEAFIATLQEAGDLHLAAGQQHLTVLTTDHFKRRQAISGIGQAPELASRAFELTMEKPLAEAPVKTRGGYVVMALHDRRLPSEEAYLAEIESVSRELQGRKRQEMHQTLLTHLREKSTIIIEEAYQF